MPSLPNLSPPTITGAGAYCSIADVRNVLDPEGSEGDMASAAGMSNLQLLVAIEEAQAEVDARIGSLYSAVLPLNPVPLVIKNATRDIAAYKATLTYLKGQPLANTDPVWLRYQDARSLVTGVSTGAITIPNGTGGTVAEDQSSGSELTNAVANPYDGQLFTLVSEGLSQTRDGQTYRTNPWTPRFPSG